MGPGAAGKLRYLPAGGSSVRASKAIAIAVAIALVVAVNFLHVMRTSADVHKAVDDLGAPLNANAGLTRAGRAGAGMARRPDLGSTRGSGAGGAGGGVKPLVSNEKEAAAVEYIRNVALKTPQLRRPPQRNFWLNTTTSKNATLDSTREKVRTYLASREFKQRLDALKRQEGHERGIVISAGGHYYLPQAIVLLRVLRHDLKSKLPVEIFWHGSKEMDNASLAALQEELGPLEGYDVTQLPYPKHHLPGAKLVGFPMKPYALLHSKFKQALLLDCDVLLARDPAFLFDTPVFKEFGNIFWGDIYNESLVNIKAYDYVGINRSQSAVVDLGKGDFVRYAESGQILIDRSRHLDTLEWVWFLNAFGAKHIYEFMYGDKDTYGLGFAMAGKAHLYHQLNVPPAGLFTNLANLGWTPGKEQMNKQGNWWLNAFAHYGPDKELLLFHRVTGELGLGRGTPLDEVITPPMPMSWTTYYMGLGPSDKLQYTLHVTPFNVTQLIDTAPPSQACPLLAWAAYWTLRTHGIPTDRQLRLEAACDGMLRAEYGDAGAALIKDSGLMDNPMRLVINSKWDDLVDGWWNKPKAPMLAVPLNMTAGYAVWRSMDAALKWTNEWAPKHIPVLKKGRRSSQRRRRRGRRLFGG